MQAVARRVMRLTTYATNVRWLNIATPLAKRGTDINTKKQCESVAELHDEQLFKQPPPLEDCPICFQRLPYLDPTGKKYMTCCGKDICSGCVYAPLYDDQGNEVDNEKCPFCRTPFPASNEKELYERYKIRVEMNDPIAIYNTGNYYRDGKCGYPQDHTKALEMFHRAAELGHAEAYLNIGSAHHRGRGIDVDIEKAIHYWELGAIKGDETARHNLGLIEENAGNIDRARKHHMVAIRGGYFRALEKIKELYTNGHATKEDYTKALQSYQTYLGEIKSKQRDEAAAFDERYRYY